MKLRQKQWLKNSGISGTTYTLIHTAHNYNLSNSCFLMWFKIFLRSGITVNKAVTQDNIDR